ncbi:MAG: hypothetical protein QOE89_1381, partial [Pseudonocardiales bacterium]|nr:hypothetical protein [Pseudonocardiales bacterium]
MTTEAQSSATTSGRLRLQAETALQRAGSRLAPATPTRWRAKALTALTLTVITGLAIGLRFWQLDKIGFNSDEAVYSGTAASIAGNDTMRSLFPIFRAHPLFLQILLSFGMHGEVSDWAARAITSSIGVATVLATYLLGKRLYGTPAGLIAALLLAVMPYHVIVSRQVLLDGLMTLCTT